MFSCEIQVLGMLVGNCMPNSEFFTLVVFFGADGAAGTYLPAILTRKS